MLARLKSVLPVMAVAASCLALCAAPANAVTYPTDSQTFTIHPREESGLCAEAEGRSNSGTRFVYLVPRPCTSRTPAQQFSFDPQTGHMRNAGRPGECVVQVLAGYAVGLGMGPCGSGTKFLPTPEDRHIQMESDFGRGRPKACASFSREGVPMKTQECNNYGSLEFAVEPV
ncbi:hypothetical protein [Streptomyces xanthochromogenes]|uniref:hypothetical protein n=1 Tax=Streptomyces xanthochromogenes TaxID=67384 RepID=UPI0034353A49